MESGRAYPVINGRPIVNWEELPADYTEELRPGVERHMREELVCEICGRRKVARRDKLMAALDTLAGNDVPSWPLAGIERILSAS
jgi:hypothetical protein